MKTSNQIKAEIENIKAEIEDWSSRVYKSSSLKVTDTYTDGFIYADVPVNYINEKRRRNRILSLKSDLKELQTELEKTLVLEAEKAENLLAKKHQNARLSFLQIASELGYKIKNENTGEIEDIFTMLENDEILEQFKKDHPEKVKMVNQILGIN